MSYSAVSALSNFYQTCLAYTEASSLVNPFPDCLADLNSECDDHQSRDILHVAWGGMNSSFVLYSLSLS